MKELYILHPDFVAIIMPVELNVSLVFLDFMSSMYS